MYLSKRSEYLGDALRLAMTWVVSPLHARLLG